MRNLDFAELGGAPLEQRFEVGAEMTRGTMAAVYEGRDLRLDRAVAIKVSRRSEQQALLAARLRNEALALSRIADPRILAPLSYGELPGGLVYVVLEMFEGASLNALIADRGRLTEQMTSRVLLELAFALEEVHAAGVVHRNIKPANVFIQRTMSGRLRVRLLDFGIAKIPAARETDLTEPGQFLGSPGFAAPEQFRGAADPRSDLYSLGMVGYAALLGRAPYAGATASVMQAQLQAPLPRVSALLEAGVDPGLDDLLHHLTRPGPGLRPASARLAREALERCVGPEREMRLGASVPRTEILTRMTTPGSLGWSLGPPEAPPASDPPRRTPRRLPVLALAALAAIMVVGGWVGLGRRDPSRAEVVRAGPVEAPMESAAAPRAVPRAGSPASTSAREASPRAARAEPLRPSPTRTATPSRASAAPISAGETTSPKKRPAPARASPCTASTEPEREAALSQLSARLPRLEDAARRNAERCLGLLEVTTTRYPARFRDACARCERMLP